MKRLFIAIKIEPSAELLARYEALRAKLSMEKITWVAPDKMHITLKFFGDTFEDRIPDITSVMEETSRHHGPLRFHIRGTGIFGSKYKPRVIWLGIPDMEPLKMLGEELIAKLEEKGWENDRQNFVPHLTIGRIKYIRDKQYFQKVIDDFGNDVLQKAEVGEMLLYESKLGSQGPRYTVISKIDLKG